MKEAFAVYFPSFSSMNPNVDEGVLGDNITPRLAEPMVGLMAGPVAERMVGHSWPRLAFGRPQQSRESPCRGSGKVSSAGFN